MLDGGGGGGFPRNLPDAGGEIKVNHDVLENIYKKLQADRDGYDDHGVPGTYLALTQDSVGLVGAAELGRYPAVEGQGGIGGEGLAATTQNAYNSIGSTYQNFLTAYQGVIDAIKTSANTHKNTEDINQQNTRSVGNGPPTGTTFEA